MRWDITSKQSITGIATWQVNDVNGLVDCKRKFRRAARDAHLRKNFVPSSANEFTRFVVLRIT